MDNKKLANYILSIFKTLDINNSHEFQFLNDMSRKDTPSKKDQEELAIIFGKYRYIIERLIKGEKNNRIAKIAAMNNICYYYYENLLNVDSDSNEFNKNILLEINEDIKTFNLKYTDINYIKSIESKYINMLEKLSTTYILEA